MADENTDLRCYLTNAGIAAENNSIQLNRSIKVTEMVFGSGLLADEWDPRAQTAMIHEEYSVPCAMLFDTETPSLLMFKGDLPADVGGFHINEVGIRLEDGTIYGYARGKGDYKPTLEQGATDSVRYAVDMYTDNADMVIAEIDLSTVYVDYEDFTAHKEDADPHTQYLLEKSDRLIFPNESQFNAMRERNNSKFAASDFVYHGKHYRNVNEEPINQGLNSSLSLSNEIRMGRRASDGLGDSSRAFPLFNASGVMLDLSNLKNSGAYCSIGLPPAPNGTVTYDSATGVVTDFTKDAGHYAGEVGYETVAERAAISGLSTLNEAVASAFEGTLSNGDFRFGDNGDWEVISDRGSMVINDGVMTIIDTTGIGGVGVGSSQCLKSMLASAISGVEYTLEFECISNPDDLVIRTDYFLLNTFHSDFSLGRNTVSWVQDVSGVKDNVFLIYARNGGTVELKNISFRPSSYEVVTDRVDMTGLETFQEEVTNGEVFPTCIQNVNSSVIAGVPMRLSARPKSYFQVYDGQYADNAINDEFYCWDWSALTAIQKAQVADYLKGTAFVNSAGNLVQWRVRNRSFAGAGNGDWKNVNSEANSGYLQFDAKRFVKPKGIRDNALPENNQYPAYPSNMGADALKDGNKAVFSAVSSSGVRDLTLAYSGECYFYVIATVPRLNQGAYHPSVNPKGTRGWNSTSSGSRSFWYSSEVPSNPTKKDAFHNATIDWVDGHYGYREDSGYIGKLSYHPSGLAYDAIGSSGQGGVIDHRLKYGAWDASSSEQAAVVREEVKNGTYRGREKLVFTHVQTGTQSSGAASTNAFSVDDVSKFIVGDLVSIVSDGVIIAKERIVTSIGSSNITFDGAGVGRDVKAYYFVVTTKTNITVEGEFTQTDVIGNPANILQVDALKDGWLGGWVPVIPDGTSQEFALSRKALAAPSGIQTFDDGLNWSSNSFSTYNSVKNLCEASWPVGNVLIAYYKAFAKQTKQSANLSVLGGESGLQDVFISQSFNTIYGSLLFESLLGNIHNHSEYATGDYGLIRYGFEYSSGGSYLKSIWGYPTIPTHEDISLRSSENGGNAGKALFHQIAENNQANLNIIANELIYDASSFVPWGDDSTMKVAASSTFPDLNGNVCKSDIHKLPKPYGWIKDDI